MAEYKKNKKDGFNGKVETAKKLYRKCVEAEQKLREMSLEDIRFENGDQWDERDRAQRNDEGRPCLVVNKVSGVLKQVVGDARKNRPRIKARGVDGQSDPELAQMLTGLIKNIENNSDAESAYDWAFECAARGGFGFFRVITDYADDDVFEQDIKIERVHDPFAIFMDHNHKEPTGCDSNYAFELDMMSREAFEAEYPGKEATSWDTTGIQEVPLNKDDYIWVARYWYKKPVKKQLFLLASGQTVEIEKPKVESIPGPMGMVDVVSGENLTVPEPFIKTRSIDCHDIKWCKLSGTDVLEEGDWAGKYIPIIKVSGEEKWVDGERQLLSVHRHAKDAQKLYNWSRSLGAEALASAPRNPWIVPENAIEGYEQMWNTSHRKIYPYLPYKGGIPPQRMQNPVGDIGAYNEAAVSADDIKSTTGVFDASLGAKGNETSGRAIIARQAEGDTATFVFHDNLMKAIRHAGKIIVDLIPKIYDTERTLRIMNEDGSEAWAMFNKIVPGPDGQPMILNDLAVGKYDVVIDTGPNYQTQRIESADGMIQFIQAFPPSAPVVGPRLAKVLDFPEAQEIAEELKALSQPPQGPSPEQQLEMQKEQMGLQKDQLDIEGKALINAEREQKLIEGQQDQMQQMYSVAQQAVQDILVQLGIIQ